MFGRRGNRLQELIRGQREESRSQHEEMMVYLSQREEEMREESRQRKEESRRREEELKLLIEASERRTEETREFNREILLRNEKVYTGVLVRLEEMGKEIRSNTEETRAQTQALLRLIDRFDQPGGAAAA